MDNLRDNAVMLLKRHLKLLEQSRQFAQYKLKYLRPSCPNNINQIQEFELMAENAKLNIEILTRTLKWLESLEA